MSGIASGELLKGRYRLERLLGRGGMAAVWLGEDEVLERPVAVKVLSDTIASDPEFVARFRREARTAAAISHPNLVGVYDYSDGEERPYLVMQFVPGEDLASRLARGGAVDCERLARELLEALAHVHDAGILHRDVKPGNVILEPSGRAKLIDFGIALPRDATALTSTGLILGTERYAAPEVMEGRAATERSDLYSCGVVLRACLDGSAPHLRPLAEWLADPDPRARPASARQALARLERGAASAGESTQAFKPVLERPRSQPGHASQAATPRARPAGRGSRMSAVAALLGVLAALTVAAAVVLGGSDGPARKGAARAGDGQGQHPQRSRSDRPEGGGAASPVAIPSGDDPTAGAALNEEGYALIQAGEYEAAVPVLEEAIRAFPPGTEDLDYAYALYNLGNALRLSGRPRDAIPILERRLRIPNQVTTVERELELAREEAN